VGWAGRDTCGDRRSEIGTVTERKPNTKMPRERPRQRWKDRADKDLEGLGTENGVELAKDRDRWRQVGVAAMGLNGL